MYWYIWILIYFFFVSNQERAKIKDGRWTIKKVDNKLLCFDKSGTSRPSGHPKCQACVAAYKRCLFTRVAMLGKNVSLSPHGNCVKCFFRM